MVAVITALRIYMFVPITAGLCTGFILMLLSKKSYKTKLIFIAALGLTAAAFVYLFQMYLPNYIEYMRDDTFFTWMNMYRQYSFAKSETGIQGYDISTMSQAITQLPIFIFHYIFKPYPTAWFGMGSEVYHRLLAPDMVIWYLLIPFMLYGWFDTVRKKHIIGISIIVYMLVFLGINALIVGNVGALYRYRMMFQMFAFVFAGIGLYRAWLGYGHYRKNQREKHQ
jgi:hypothetical protein